MQEHHAQSPVAAADLQETWNSKQQSNSRSSGTAYW